MVLTSERLELRPWTLDDAEGAFAVYRDPEVNRYIGGTTPANLDEMRDTLARWIQRSMRYPPGTGAFAARLDGTIIGCGLLKPLPYVPPDAPPGTRVLTDDIEVGWHLGLQWWGQGFATEMGRRLVDHGFADLGLTEIHCVVEPPNVASKRVAQRLGFAPQGRTSAYYGLELDHFLRHAA